MYIFIINPVAGNGRAKRIYRELKKDPDYASLHPVHYFTKYSGHAELIAQEITEKVNGETVQGIVIIGGDGTLHEVMNGLQLRHLPVSFLAGGSGNDFARGMHLSKSPKTMLSTIKSNVNTVEYWLGTYETNHLKTNYFVNCIGFGFDAVVASRVNKSRYKKLFNRLYLGSLVYLFALLKELISFKPVSITVQLDGVEKSFSRCMLFLVNNHPYFGGGMKINPTATNNATNYSIIVIDSISKWKILALFGTVFTGRHLGIKGVSTYEASEIICTAKQPVLFQVDGETSSTTYCKIRKSEEAMHIRTSKHH